LGEAFNDPRIKDEAYLAYSSTIIDTIIGLSLVWLPGDSKSIILIDFKGMRNAKS